MITIVDYDCGNLFSLGQALAHLGAEFRVSDDAAELAGCERIILPGVGAFGDGIARLRERGLVAPIRAAAERGVPFLGICLGMQLMAERGEEFGDHEGLGLIPGAVVRMPDGDDRPDRMRIPNVGWRRLEDPRPDSFLGGIPDGAMAYFVHSFALHARDVVDVAATITVNGLDVVAAFQRGTLCGTQFHPEKSGPLGLEMIRRFLELPAAGGS